jgi:prepilin-type N-terminal cleavage/methylation domain-containing protein
MRRRASRAGFTLIEVIAAIAISTVLLAAVYVTLGLMLTSVRAGKEAIASLQIVRGTAVRLKADIRQSLGMLAVTPSVDAALAQAAAANTSGSTSTGTSSTTQSTDTEPAQFNLGLQGDDSQLTIYGSRLPIYSSMDADTPNNINSDLRMISYNVQSEGLVRQEIVNVLSDSDQNGIPEVLAPEVKEAHFRYFDPVAKAWQSSWDGTTNGPPAAVEVTLTIQMPDKPGMAPQQPFVHRLVIAIPTFGSLAQGVTQQ